MNHWLWVIPIEKNIHILEKKKRPTLSYQLKKINRYAIDGSKEKNTVIAGKLQVQKSAQY